jgi:hypothetical protein
MAIPGFAEDNVARPTLKPHRPGDDGKLQRQHDGPDLTEKKRASQDVTGKGAKELPLEWRFDEPCIWPPLIL